MSRELCLTLPTGDISADLCRSSKALSGRAGQPPTLRLPYSLDLSLAARADLGLAWRRL